METGSVDCVADYLGRSRLQLLSVDGVGARKILVLLVVVYRAYAIMIRFTCS